MALNPVRAKLVRHCADWRWSSAAAHLAGKDDHVVKVKPALDRVGDFAAFLAEEVDEDAGYAALRRAETIGRPVGSPEWLAGLEALTGKTIAAGKRGPKKGAWVGTRNSVSPRE